MGIWVSSYWKRFRKTFNLGFSENKSFVFVHHFFNEMPSQEIINELKLKKKTITLFKEYIENKNN